MTRYSHHSTLLYAVPPSSISCLDMLVNLYGWTGGILSEQGGHGYGYGYTDTQMSSSADASSNSKRPSLSALDMREEMSVSLARLAGLRGELLDRWDMRNDQTNRLEAQADPGRVSVDALSISREPVQSPNSILQRTPVSSSGIEHREAPQHHRRHRIHKIQKSVGGKLRDLLGSGSSSKDLAALERGSERSNRNSFDVSVLTRPYVGANGGRDGGLAGPAILEETDVHAAGGAGGVDGTKSSPLPAIESTSMPSRPAFPARRSMNLSPTEVPFLVDSSLFPLAPPSLIAEPRSFVSSQASSNGASMPEREVAGVAGPGTGLGLGLPSRTAVPVRMQPQSQQVEELEDVGRKREGVLWGGGTWEDVGRQGKTRWEKYWVVLDHSSIYEVSSSYNLSPRVYDRPRDLHR